MNWLCLDCSQPLADRVTPMTGDYLRCSCGVKYALDLFQTADFMQWERIRMDRLFDRDGSVLICHRPLTSVAM